VQSSDRCRRCHSAWRHDADHDAEPDAAGLPTSGDPILIDVSTSITSMGYTQQRKNAGEKLPGPWLIDAQGNATDDPNVLWKDPKGALLPLGGLDAGHKGFGLGLMVEALTAGLSGFGRADPREGWAARCSAGIRSGRVRWVGRIQAANGFHRRCRARRNAAARCRPVRMPGERGMQRYREQRANGWRSFRRSPALAPWAEKLGAADALRACS
jgi:L-lactate dehydrogenase